MRSGSAADQRANGVASCCWKEQLGTLTPRQNELLVTARDDAERLLRILNDLLDLTRLEEGHTDLYKERTPPSELVHSAADILTRDAIANRNLRLTLQG